MDFGSEIIGMRASPIRLSELSDGIDGIVAMKPESLDFLFLWYAINHECFPDSKFGAKEKHY